MKGKNKSKIVKTESPKCNFLYSPCSQLDCKYPLKIGSFPKIPLKANRKI